MKKESSFRERDLFLTRSGYGSGFAQGSLSDYEYASHF
jgi:hypothetical protein